MTVGMVIVISSIILGLSFIVVSIIIASAINKLAIESDKIIERITAVIIRFSDIYSEWVEYQATYEPRSPDKNEKNRPSATQEKSISDKIGSIMEGNTISEDQFKGISNKAKTAVQFGEDV